jgi:Radical SAM superfamily
MKRLLLLQPPATKPSEPPLSLAILLGHLRRNGIEAAALDGNLGAYQYLLQPAVLEEVSGSQPATAVRRALKHLSVSLARLRSAAAVTSFDRYATAVHYLNTLLDLYRGQAGDERLTLGDYQHQALSPFAPEDLTALAHGEAATLFADYFQAELLPRITAHRPELIAISVNYLNQVLPAFELAGMLKREMPELELIGGGGLLTSWKQMLCELDLRLPPFDRVVFGPGEAPLLALARGEASDEYFLEDSSLTGFVPDYSFAELEKYLSPEPVLPLSTSRGCYWKQCQFCPEASAPVHPFAMAGQNAIPDLMRQFATDFGVRHFHLTDNAIPVRQLDSLAAASLLLEGLNWHGFVRFEPALEDGEFVRRLAASGCRMLQLGLESGSQQVLDRLDKGIQLAGVERILENLQDAGIASYVYVMLGIPGETEADAELTRTFLLEHATKIDYLNLSIMNLPRGSGLLDNPQEHGIATSHLLGEAAPLSLYQSFASTSGWDRKAARRFLDQRLLGEVAIRTIVRRTPPWFTSNHAHFFGKQCR